MPQTSATEHVNFLRKFLRDTGHPPSLKDGKRWEEGVVLSGLQRRDDSLTSDVAYARDHYFESWLQKRKECSWDCKMETKFPKSSSWRATAEPRQCVDKSTRGDMLEDKCWGWPVPQCDPVQAELTAGCCTLGKAGPSPEPVRRGCGCDACMKRASITELAPDELVDPEGHVVSVITTPSASVASCNSSVNSTSPKRNSPRFDAFRNRAHVRVDDLKERLHKHRAKLADTETMTSG